MKLNQFLHSLSLWATGVTHPLASDPAAAASFFLPSLSLLFISALLE